MSVTFYHFSVSLDRSYTVGDKSRKQLTGSSSKSVSSSSEVLEIRTKNFKVFTFSFKFTPEHDMKSVSSVPSVVLCTCCNSQCYSFTSYNLCIMYCVWRLLNCYYRRQLCTALCQSLLHRCCKNGFTRWFRISC